jgi:hypothetical protein
MPNGDHTNDVFAAIALNRTQNRLSGLETPQPPKLSRRTLPLKKTSKTPFDTIPKLSSAADLSKELCRYRNLYAPFMRNFAPALPQTRKKIDLPDFDWRIETPLDREDFSNVVDGRGNWERVKIPHYGEPLGKAATYYRTIFNVQQADLQGNSIFACFKGVDYKAHVFINNSYLGSHEGFFAPFEFDLTQYVRAGENILVVKVENDYICGGNNGWDMPFSGDKIYAATGLGYDDPVRGWHHCPPGMGIYQDAYIEIRPRIHICDIYVRVLPKLDKAQVWVEIFNCDVTPKDIIFEFSVFGQNTRSKVFVGRRYHPNGNNEIGMGDTFTEALACRNGTYNKPVALRIEKGHNRIAYTFETTGMRLWEPEKPWLYQLQAKLLDTNENTIDCSKQHFGIRSFAMDTDSTPKGQLRLNGRPIRLRGANTMGHEQQCVFKKDWDQLRDDILLAKICNMNFLRLTQRPVQKEVYEYCDMLGMMTQTDLPLFGVLRYNQYFEAIKQVGEMVRLVRPHPCNIMISYINEPFPNSGNKPHRHLSREELHAFFESADKAAHHLHPELVIKPVDGDYDPPAPGITDRHCYPCWYNGHGIDIGKLHKGYWQPVKKNWYYACGEFGAEGLDHVDVMRKYYPKDWLPQSKDEKQSWSPEKIISAQTGSFHHFFFDTPRTLKDWVSASQSHQAWAAQIMTECFRRDNRMTSFAIHLFIDAFPAGWMKAIMDVDRQPKPAYFAYRNALAPLLPMLRADRFKFFSGEKIKLEAWVSNDLPNALNGVNLQYQCRMNSEVFLAGKKLALIPACGSKFQGMLDFAAPKVTKRSNIRVEVALVENGKVLNDSHIDIEVFPDNPVCKKNAYIVGKPSGKASLLAKELGLLRSYKNNGKAELILVDNFDLYAKNQNQILESVKRGAVLVFLELPQGPYEIAGKNVIAKPSSFNPIHFASINTEHPMVSQFLRNDFRLWYDPAHDCITPLLYTTFVADGFAPILTSANLNSHGSWHKEIAAGEMAFGSGYIYISQIQLAGRIDANPTAKIFAQRLLRLKSSV